ncbi:MAG: multiple sugar transport system permease protein, partial [Gaiellaceae bacterium]|nr:multiple sugar transport system permease protein [Gaiellaceae bacterium]
MIRRRPRQATAPTHAIVSPTDWHRPRVRWSFGVAQAVLLVGLVVIGLGPILWLAKSAITPTIDTITHPVSLFPHGTAWHNLHEAWYTVHVGRYFWNTVVLALGSWACQILVATTGGY